MEAFPVQGCFGIACCTARFRTGKWSENGYDFIVSEVNIALLIVHLPMCVTLPNMTHAKHGHSLIFLPLAMGGGHVYASGGLEDSFTTYSQSVECLFFGASGDPTENSICKEISPLNIGRAFFGAVVHRRGILIVGGFGAGGVYPDTVEVFQRTKINGFGQWS